MDRPCKRMTTDDSATSSPLTTEGKKVNRQTKENMDR